MKNTSWMIEKIMDRCETISQGFVTYYQYAPRNASFPYGVISEMREAGEDVLSFVLELWTDNSSSTQNQDIEELCDKARNALDQYAFIDEVNGGGHIEYDYRESRIDSEKQLNHRRLGFDLVCFYPDI